MLPSSCCSWGLHALQLRALRASVAVCMPSMHQSLWTPVKMFAQHRAGGTNGCRPQASTSLSRHDGSMQQRECHSRTLRAKYGGQPCGLFTWQQQQLRTSTTRMAFSTNPGAEAADSASAVQQDAQHSHTSRSGPDAVAQPHATVYDRWQSILQQQPHLQSFESTGACSTASSPFQLNYNPAQQLQEQASALQLEQVHHQQPDHQTTPHPDPAQQQPPAQQQWPPYPEEVLLIGVDPDTNGAIAVIHSQLHWTTTAPGSTTAAAVVPSSRRRPRKTNESSNGRSRRTSSSSSSSTEEVPQVQAYMALPAAAVKVYDMPVETIVTKTKTQTGKARIRRRLDICQAMTIIRQVLQNTAATADTAPPATLQSMGNSSNGHSSSNCGSSGGSGSRHDTAVAVKCNSNGSSSNGTGSAHTNGSNSSSNGTAATGLSSSSSSRRILLRAVVEVASIQPSNGSLAILNQGYSVGSWCSLLSSHGFDVTTIHVKGWKKDMGLLKRDKDSSREVTRQLFAQAGAAQDHLLRTKNTHGRAEALLIAAWGLGWSAHHASGTPSLGPIRATVNMDGGMHVLPPQQQQQQQHQQQGWVRLPAAAAAAAGATSSDDECEGSMLYSSHSVTMSHSGHSSLSVFTQGVPLSSLTWLQHPLWATQGQRDRVLDVNSHMEATAAASREAAAAKAAAHAAAKEERAAARRAAAEQRAAAKAAEKAERAAAAAAAAAAKKQEGCSARARSRKGGSRPGTPDSGAAV